MLLEREHELGVLTALLERSPESGGRVVLVRGEAGVGKSALVREWIGRTNGSADVLVGGCDDLSTPEPLGPLWDVARDEPTLLESLRAGDRMGLFGALLDVLGRPERQTVLVLEDTHWVDEATLDAIKYVGRRMARVNGLLVLTYRDGEVDFDHPLRQVMGTLDPGALARLHLQPLSMSAVAGLIGDRDLDVERVFELTGGNPLFVSELLEVPSDHVPVSVRDAVIARAAKLSAEARTLLDLVAVVPGGAERPLVEAIVDPEPEHVAECIRQGLLDTDVTTVLSFRHELSRQAVESALDPLVRQSLNQRVLDELRPEGNASRLIHHALRAGDEASIVEFAPIAAGRAVELGSHAEAAAYFAILEPHLDRLPIVEQGRVLVDWARSEHVLDSGKSVAIIDRALDLLRAAGDDRALARALTAALRIHDAHSAKRDADEALAILEQLPPSAELAIALSGQSLLAFNRGQSDLAVEYADRAIAVAEQVGDELATIRAMNARGSVGDGAGRGDLRLLSAAHSLAKSAGHRYEEVLLLNNCTATALGLMELGLAGEYAQRTINGALRYEIPNLTATGQINYSHVSLLRGDWARAEELANDSAGTHSCSAWWAGYIPALTQLRRDGSAARGTLAEHWSLAEASGSPEDLAEAAAGVAEYTWLTGDSTLASLERLGEVVDADGVAAIPWDRGALAVWLWRLGALEPVPDDLPLPYALAIEGRAREAADEWARLGRPYDRALALMDADRDGQLEALEIFETLGASAVASKFRQRLRAEGVTVPRGRGRATRNHRAGLTARQAEVLELLGEGLSNAAIADRLFVSPKTVEHHVAAVLAKLGAPTRDDAVRLARSEGLVPV